MKGLTSNRHLDGELCLTQQIMEDCSSSRSGKVLSCNFTVCLAYKTEYLTSVGGGLLGGMFHKMLENEVISTMGNHEYAFNVE